jgi:hypothetical protein
LQGGECALHIALQVRRRFTGNEPRCMLAGLRLSQLRCTGSMLPACLQLCDLTPHRIIKPLGSGDPHRTVKRHAAAQKRPRPLLPLLSISPGLCSLLIRRRSGLPVAQRGIHLRLAPCNTQACVQPLPATAALQSQRWSRTSTNPRARHLDGLAINGCIQGWAPARGRSRWRRSQAGDPGRAAAGAWHCPPALQR